VGGVSDRLALVLGGGRGLGRAIALARAEGGADVLVVGRSAARLSDLKAVAAAKGFPIRTARADASRPKRLKALVGEAGRSRRPRGRAAASRVRAGRGGPDILVIATGDYWEGPLATLTGERWEALAHSNVSIAIDALRATLPGMRRRRYGRVLLFGVAGGEGPRAAPRAHAYRAAKLALLTLARSAAQEEAPFGITINVILPGIIQTGIPPRRAARLASRIPAGRLGTPREIARVATFLLAEESGYLTGAAIPVAGGYLL